MAEIWTKFIIILTTLVLQICAEEAIPCNENYQCVPLSQCHLGDRSAFIYPCHSGLNLICCPSGSYNSSVPTELANRKTSLFPVNCGIVLTSDKISGGDKADIGQFPWMALLGYRQKQLDYTQFLCGGSVITERYILTAAHCINIDRRLELVVVRLGELNLLTEKDCEEFANVTTCADPYVDKPIDQVIAHPSYSNNKLHNDIALIKVKEKIQFTDFIKPICLPFERNLETADLTRQKLTVSGWGKTRASNLGGSTSLQFASVRVWNQTVCSKSVPPDVKPIRDTQLCANGERTEDACKGDSGGPLVNATVDSDGELRYFQLGVVSFASTQTCGNPTLPTVYTRVDKFLNWVVDTVS